MKNSELRILVAEDEPSMGMVLKARLDKLREYFPTAKVQTCDTIEEAAKLIIDGDPPFDVLILDLSFPDSSFEETIERIEGFQEHSAVVLVTGRKKHEVEAILGSRVCEIVEKGPEIFEPSFFQAIARAVNRRRDKQSEERLQKIDDIFQQFYALPNANIGKGLPAA